jgi:tRNA-dihydrouridine synthase B
VLRFGSLSLPSNLCLSPLAGYTNLPFRLVVRELGGLGLATTDLVNARSLIERNRKALKLVESNERDRPMAVQLFGSKLEEMRDAALVAESMGASAIDINMGCPVRKVCRVGGGSAMMTEIGQTCRIAESMVRAVRIPVTAKMRLGWDDESWTAPELARALEDSGVAGIFVHGRTRAQGFSGRVRLEGIRRVVAAVRAIPVVGNGDVTTPDAALRMLNETGCAGVSIGRGAFYDPWIFRRTRALLDDGVRLPEPEFPERVRLMRRHLALMAEVFGETVGCTMFRKVAPWYARRFGPANEFTRRVVRLESQAEFEEILAVYLRWRAQFCDAEGRLLPRFAPAPMVAGFEGDEGTEETGVIPVPAGPVSLW